MSDELAFTDPGINTLSMGPSPKDESMVQKNNPKRIPYEECMKIIQKFWEEYDKLPPEFRRTRRSQESDILSNLWLENVRQHYDVKEVRSIHEAEWLINKNLERLRKSTAAILNDLRKMDERDRKRAYRARKKKEKLDLVGGEM